MRPRKHRHGSCDQCFGADATAHFRRKPRGLTHVDCEMSLRAHCSVRLCAPGFVVTPPPLVVCMSAPGFPSFDMSGDNHMIRPCRILPALLMAIVVQHSVSANEPKKAPGPDAVSRGTELFEKQILPALVKHCYACHSRDSETIEAGLELDSRAGLLRGGDSGPMFKAHHAEGSSLLQMLRHHKDVSAMPPEEKLSAEVIAAFEEWIRLGAPDPRNDSGPTARDERLEKTRGHWAFQPPQSSEPPAVKDPGWSRDRMIDDYVLARLEANGLQPVADATRRTIVRRVYFDLIGLPPSPRDVDAFVANESPQALENLVDQLLASPQFGERWGRHWLDVVRFAESSGMEFNFSYPHAWPYRDYVIDSFTADKPFDVFLREQIAGDLMEPAEDESPREFQARHVATSLLAFGPKRHNSSGTEFQVDIASDQIEVITKATMALTVSCAKCHDHKFDPIPTKDYYALAGIFRSTEPLYGTIKQKYSNTPTDLLPIGENARAMHDAAELYEKRVSDSEKTLADAREKLKKAATAEKSVVEARTAAEAMLAAIAARRTETGADVDQPADTSELEVAQAELANVTAKLSEARAVSAALKEAIANQEAELDDLKKNRPPRPQYAMSVRDRAKPADAKLALRGDFRSPGDVIPRGFLSAVIVPNSSPVNPTSSGRLELAQWITSPDNPLTARVMVNRVWHHLFGRGIVPTVDNFGLIGKPPTHPQLLDALTLRFIKEGWSVKRLVKSIVLSRTYQLSSQVNAQNRRIDPDNRLLWRATPKRLSAESIRDAILTVSGKLDLQRPVGSTVTGLGDKLVRGIAPEKLQPPGNHRSVYLPVIRDYIPELFDLFDFPSPSLVSGRRAVTNVPSQALYLRNSVFAAEHSRHAAERLLAMNELVDDAGRVSLAMEWSLGRQPSDVELAAALQLVNDSRQAGREDKSATVDAWTSLFLTLFTTAEFRYLVDIKS